MTNEYARGPAKKARNPIMLGDTNNQPVRRSSSDWVAFSLSETLGDNNARNWIEAKKANPTHKKAVGFGKNSEETASPINQNGLN
jgi:reverse gyrase